MKRKLALVVCTSAAVAAMASPAAATPTDPPNCHGASLSSLTLQYGSAKAAADAFSVSVKDGQDLVRVFCETGVTPV